VSGLVALAAALVLLAGCTAGADRPAADSASTATTRAPAPWVTRAIPEARGDFRAGEGNRREAIRYPGWAKDDFGAFRTYAYDDTRAEPAVRQGPVPRIAGDPLIGRRLFLDRSRGPCTGCHLVRGDDVWPAGNVGPDLSSIGDRGLTDAHLFEMIYDPRRLYPQTTMPPWGVQGGFSPVEIVHLVAFLQTQKGPLPPEKGPERNPETRARPTGFGDNLDPTNNPAVVRAEAAAEDLWTRRGTVGKSCADCHAGGPLAAMRGVATRYPRHVAPYGRVLSIEDLLEVHGPERAGLPLPAESADNLDLAMVVKMASNGMPVQLDLSTPEHRAALERGRATFSRRVGQRNHACADCHTAGKGADRFLGGRLLASVEHGLTRHFPTWRTSQSDVWDMRKRMQWCMTPLGMNMLAADAVEYAELELFLASFDQGKPISVPGIRH